jgi:PleD family two-component response regulator
MISSADVHHAKVLIVDDQSTNVLLLDHIAQRRLSVRHVHDGPA